MKSSILLLLCVAGTATAQQRTAPFSTAPVTPYRATAPRVNDLVHTKLDVRFDYAKRYLYGKEWVTLKPRAYATDSLRLDAQGMDIKAVALVRGGGKPQPLKYDYNQQQLLIRLGQPVAAGEAYTVYIEYTAKPDELKAKGSAAITDAKGLYFVNPDSAVAGKPVQIWTQGETESNSAWFPTIDKPNQKSTSEIAMTVPAKYVTLSNGALVSQTPAGAELRTDTWKMDQPHAPYLFMMAVGDFKIQRERWRGKELSYYVEPRYAAQTKEIFGKTPKMLDFFSQRLGLEFPWNKYAQIVVRDYVSGAMENTTASLFGEHAQGTRREILDREYADVEREVAHELFHQWFGDYVTAESWSNLTVNESFANFSEILWAEHELGADAGAAQAQKSRSQYLRSVDDGAKTLVRFQYDNKEDMFDLVSYQKGGAILNMLRNYLGEEVFFQGLNRYLTQNALGTGEAPQLRLALEQVSGQDLNWFFNQWYYQAGHPKVTISYRYDAKAKTQAVTVKQTQAGPAFILPITVDVHVKGQPERHTVWLRDKEATFRFPAARQPELVNVDAEKVLLWEKVDDKPLAQFAYQQQHAARYLDRQEALAAAQTEKPSALTRQILLAGLRDLAYDLRKEAIEGLDLKEATTRKVAEPLLVKLATTDPSVHVQAAALAALGSLEDKRHENLFDQALASESYAVQGAALTALASLNPEKALAQARRLEGDNRKALTQAIVEVYALSGDASKWAFALRKFDEAGPQDRLNMIGPFSGLLVRVDDAQEFAKGVDRIKEMGVKYKAYGIDKPLLLLLQNMKAAKTGNAPAEQVLNQAVKDIEAAK